MRIVFHAKSENKQKAEDLLKQDDLVSRGSIAVRNGYSLGIQEDGYFIIVDASDQALEKAKDLLKDLAEIYKDSPKVLDKYDEQENAAIEGFGGVLGTD
ncbi:MAG: hypothetical protein HY513_05265 [Candidatus Aenigmarchaeota archaeon]|nr:hypothetical protein [Candidatus Aenigmarchaeota archaeon]